MGLETEVASGAPETNSESQDQKKDSVSYDTYKRVLAEAKSAKEKNREILERLDGIERERKDALEKLKGKEEAKLLEQGEFKKLLDVRERELQELQARLHTEVEYKSKAEKDLIDSYKMQAVLSKLPGRIGHKDYFVHIDLDAIAVNPETRQIDESSLSEVVGRFVKEHPTLIRNERSGLRLPSDAPAGYSDDFSPEAYAKKDLKEMKKALPEAVRAYKAKLGVK